MAKILVVDDEEVLRMLLMDTLEDEGHDVLEAIDGRHALKLLEENGDIDLVILDNMMPGLTGIEVAKQLDEEWKEKHPILMLTAKTQQSDLDESREAGIPYYMAKPFSPAQLVLLVEDILNA
ncbi:response regulator transcription factor [Aquibacillus koreensis]|uniref:Response regulator transcription factor n=1 Tax=Aquibacillus koreensis TaxID=279446 RepID=A0A9X3WMM7_9BACI|nr:response regulator transcription factor [Aquibacillus koreensis]MCT2535624.1 response regulator transcription factor [Aquibacillus koreensis]MDC3420091.1 response regulator transcription factor [Aquibacillus koreensis]